MNDDKEFFDKVYPTLTASQQAEVQRLLHNEGYTHRKALEAVGIARAPLYLPAPKATKVIPAVLKADGRLQRADTALSLPIAIALRERVLKGEPLYPAKAAAITLKVKEGDIEKTVKIPKGTLIGWVYGNKNVIPGIGQALQAYLEQARQDRRVIQHREMVKQAEEKLTRTLGLDTLKPAVGMFGIIKDAEGNIVMKEDARVLEIQMKTAMFVTERLSPAEYSPTLKSQNTHLHLTMTDLRKARETREAQTNLTT